MPKVEWDEGSGFAACPARRAQWARAYPLVHIAEQLERAHAWYLDNPKKRKKDHTRFLGAWMSRQQERAAKEQAERRAPRPNDEVSQDNGTMARMQAKMREREGQ